MKSRTVIVVLVALTGLGFYAAFRMAHRPAVDVPCTPEAVAKVDAPAVASVASVTQEVGPSPAVPKHDPLARIVRPVTQVVCDSLQDVIHEGMVG